MITATNYCFKLESSLNYHRATVRDLIFHGYIREFHVVEKDLLYHELARARFDYFHKRATTIYFIAKTSRLRFIPGSFRPTGNFCFVGDVICGARRERVVFNIAKILYARSGVCDKYDGWEDWASHIMSRWKIDGEVSLDNAEVYRRLSSVDLMSSNHDYLYIDCKLWQGIMKGDMALRTIVTPMQLAQFFDWDLLDPIELIYIGKSTDGVLQRARNHNKWGKITSNLHVDEIALIYFLDLETTSLTREETDHLTVAERFADEHIDRSAQALIIEAAFIKYFFDEKLYNEMVVQQEFRNVKHVKEHLVNRGYTATSAELILEGVFGNIGTKKAGFSSAHKIFVRLTDI